MKNTKYRLKSFVGQIGDFAFEWDLDGSQRKEHEEFIKKAKEDGTYGQPFELDIEVAHNPLFDEPMQHAKDSHKFVILELSE